MQATLHPEPPPPHTASFAARWFARSPTDYIVEHFACMYLMNPDESYWGSSRRIPLPETLKVHTE
jgi:hypothetical protein